MDAGPSLEEVWFDDDSDDATESERVEWDPFALLALAGLLICSIDIIGESVGGLLGTQQLPTDSRQVAALGILSATGWSNYVAAALLVVVGFTWWSAKRWSEALYEETEEWDQGQSIDDAQSAPDGDGGVVAQRAQTEQLEDQTWDYEGDPAVIHLQRLRPMAVWASLLLLVTVAANVARVFAVFLQAEPRYDWNFGSYLANEIAFLMMAFIVAVAGLTIAYRVTKLCLWWDYFPDLPEIDAETDLVGDPAT